MEISYSFCGIGVFFSLDSPLVERSYSCPGGMRLSGFGR